MGDKRILVAQIGAPHGVRGEVRLKPFTEDPLALADYGPFESEDGARQIRVLSLRPAKDMLVARIEGVTDRTAADTLKHLRLYVPRERLPSIEDEETYYHADLIGLAVVGQDGQAFGAVTAVHNYGAGDVIEIAPAAGGPTVLLPFTKSVVLVVDPASSKLVIDAEAFGSSIPSLKGEGRPRSGRGGVKGRMPKETPTRSRSARSTRDQVRGKLSPLQGED